jgi:Fe-S cluster assembly protein SufD
MVMRKHVDHYTLVQHTQIVKSSRLQSFSDRSTGVQQENLRRKKEAQKTNAFKKTITSYWGDKATINAKPQLEILRMT